MDSAAGAPPLPLSPPGSRPATRALPPSLILAALATTSIAIGGPWDISWHISIGRDTFWTPAHMAIYLGGTGCGLVCGWLAIRATFLAPAERASSVRIWGGYAPFGAWVTFWGSAAMLTSAPFDNWWHDAYGLDVKVLSPPHVLLFIGILATRLGVWLLVLREQNRSDASPAAAGLFCYLGGLATGSLCGLFIVEFWPNRQHSTQFFVLSAVVINLMLAAIARGSRLRWGTTLSAACHTLVVCGLVWILPLFPAEPKLGPVYNHVTHMVPPPFPLLTLLPAFALDLLKPRLGLGRSLGRDCLAALAMAAIFLVVFLPVQWHFARFYLSPAADNWFFAGSRIWGYSNPPGPDRALFSLDEAGWSIPSVVKTLLAGSVAAFLGLRFGNWMQRVRR